MCLAGIAYVGAGLRGLQASVEVLIQQEMQMPDELKHAWKWQGIDVTVTTRRRDGETAAAWAQRHKDNVDAALALFPKDP